MNQNQSGSKAYLFSIVLVAVLGGLLFGYDTAVISGAEKGLQAFFLGAEDFTYTDSWHGFTCASALIGCIIGSAVSGYMASNLGRKRSLIFAGVMFFISALGSMEPEFLFFEHGHADFPLLVAFNIYRVIGGVGVGLASAICPMYIAEVAPSNIRGTLVSWNQFAIIFGQLVVYMVNFFILGDHTNPVIESIGQGMSAVVPGSDPWTIETGWRYMFGSEAVPAGLFAILICFVPETPRYLVMAGQDKKALAVLTKINGEAEGRSILDEIKNTISEKTERVFTYGFLVIFVGIVAVERPAFLFRLPIRRRFAPYVVGFARKYDVLVAARNNKRRPSDEIGVKGHVGGNGTRGKIPPGIQHYAVILAHYGVARFVKLGKIPALEIIAEDFLLFESLVIAGLNSHFTAFHDAQVLVGAVSLEVADVIIKSNQKIVRLFFGFAPASRKRKHEDKRKRCRSY